MTRYSVGTVSGLVVGIMLGSFPGFDPVNSIYRCIFNSPLPEYLRYGFSAIGLFTMFYTLAAILIFTPLECALGVSIGMNSPSSALDRPSKEDLMYIPLLYLVYLATLHMNKLLTYQTALVGVFAIILPIAYRWITYGISNLMSSIRSCYYPLYLFLISFGACVAFTFLYLSLMHLLIVAA